MISEIHKQEIIDHLETTIGTMVKAYTQKQIAFMDGIDPRTVKRSGKYLPLRFDNNMSRYYQNRGMKRKTYVIRYVRLDEIKHVYKNRNRKKRLIEENI